MRKNEKHKFDKPVVLLHSHVAPFVHTLENLLWLFDSAVSICHENLINCCTKYHHEKFEYITE